MISLKELGEKTEVKYIELLRDLVHAANLIDGNSFLVKDNSTDRYRKNGSQQKKASMAIDTSNIKLLPLLLRRLINKIMNKQTMRKNKRNYLTEISKIYCTYGIYELGVIHDKRYIDHICKSLNIKWLRLLLKGLKYFNYEFHIRW